MIRFLCWLPKKWENLYPNLPRDIIEISMEAAGPDEDGEVVFKGMEEYVTPLEPMVFGMSGMYGNRNLIRFPTPRNLSSVMSKLKYRYKIEAVMIEGYEMFFPVDEAALKYIHDIANDIATLFCKCMPRFIDNPDGLDMGHAFGKSSETLILVHERAKVMVKKHLPENALELLVQAIDKKFGEWACGKNNVNIVYKEFYRLFTKTYSLKELTGDRDKDLAIIDYLSKLWTGTEQKDIKLYFEEFIRMWD